MDKHIKNARAFYLEGSCPDGCLLLHGFSGAPGHMRHLGEALNESGFTVSAPLLPGHGEEANMMDQFNFHDWLNAAQRAYIELLNHCGRVFLIGHSMGGALALILAEQYPVDGLICLAPAIRLRSRLSAAARPISAVFPYFHKRRDHLHGDDFLYDCHMPSGAIPTKSVYDVRRIIHLATSNLFAVVAPTLIFQGLHDKTVKQSGAKALYDGIGAGEKKLIWLTESDHIPMLGPEREDIAKRIIDWIVNIQDINALAK